MISRSRCIPISIRSLPPTSSSGTDGSASTGRITSISSCRASPFVARSASASSVLDFAPGLPGRHRLVEQRHDLVQLVHRGLGHERQQDRVLALLAPLQPLVGRPARHPGQEPAPLVRQR